MSLFLTLREAVFVAVLFFCPVLQPRLSPSRAGAKTTPREGKVRDKPVIPGTATKLDPSRQGTEGWELMSLTMPLPDSPQSQGQGSVTNHPSPTIVIRPHDGGLRRA